MKITRRNVLELAATLPGAAALPAAAAPPAAAHRDAPASAPLAASSGAQSAADPSAGVGLSWLGATPPAIPAGVSWGVPFAKGKMKKDQAFVLHDAAGTALPLQSWTLASWGDGSIKWRGFATTVAAGLASPLRLTPGSASAPTSAVTVRDSAAGVEVDTGRVKCVVPRSGQHIIASLSVNGTEVARQARLITALEDRSREADGVTRIERFSSIVKKVTVEQQGPVRATVRVDGMHKADSGAREWLPFTVRLYFYAGQESIKLIHSIVFDGDDQKDFIKGLGIAFTIPMREQVLNRHVRFGGDAPIGLWSEPVQPLTGRRVLRFPNRDVYKDQLEGKRVPNKEAYDRAGQSLITDWATWNGYKLFQPNPDGYVIQKRAVPEACWIDVTAGKRGSGFVFAGDVSGGLGVGLRNFWQSHPTALEVEKATTDAADLYVWMWSPDAAAMDLRHYDTRAHGLDASYEDVQPGFSTAHGVGRTSEMMLFPSASVPVKDETVKQAEATMNPPLLVVSPEYLHAAGAFGIWSLPDRSHPTKKFVEDQLDAAFAFYQKEVDQRRWYGFWNYGDIMHTYDTDRHEWRYDIGGFAWDNSELGPDLWLWYSFLRTGRADIFRMAEAMTRHTGEVDTYHLGRFAKLGSRHNVRHWGCGAKELRISQSAYRRFFYYLTTDERVGDVMHDETDADYALLTIDPMRLASPPKPGEPKFPARIRGGPDWIAAVGNWMTEWERTGNKKYFDKIITGMDSFSDMKYGFISGPNSLFGYDPATGKVSPLSDDPYGSYNLQVIMGGAEVAFELEGMIDHPSWNKTWLQYCRLVGAPKEVVARDMQTFAEDAGERNGGAGSNGRLPAYAYMKTKDVKYAKRAWDALLNPRTAPKFAPRPVASSDSPAMIEEVPGVSTNSTAQWCLNAIEVLAMAGDQAPNLP